ncbi:LysR family transcriptional regulator [Pandoraea sp. NPDC090278]|uniref:LysR family transcriptional regulator n=1 Tax=Pandoraea sp. NPDC090278 TaxID=3364391 RepID=UPI00383AD682
MDLNATLAFVTVVECGSFSAAARTLEIPRSTVSARVASLEAHLGVLLLRRSTRRMALTDDGRNYFDRAAPAIRTLREAEQFDATDVTGRRPLSGSIRLGVPFDFPFDALSQAIATFREAHPRVRFDVLVDDSVSNFVDDNLDMAIRGGQPGGDHVVARRIATFGFARFASSVFGPGRGKRVSKNIPALVFKPRGAPAMSPRSAALIATQADYAVATNSFALLRQLALHGAGAAVLPAHLCDADVASGKLVDLPVGDVDTQVGLYLVYPSRRALTPKVKAFSDHLLNVIETSANPVQTARSQRMRTTTRKG